jgi:hypothetical protein
MQDDSMMYYSAMATVKPAFVNNNQDEEDVVEEVVRSAQWRPPQPQLLVQQQQEHHPGLVAAYDQPKKVQQQQQQQQQQQHDLQLLQEKRNQFDYCHDEEKQQQDQQQQQQQQFEQDEESYALQRKSTDTNSSSTRPHPPNRTSSWDGSPYTPSYWAVSPSPLPQRAVTSLASPNNINTQQAQAAEQQRTAEMVQARLSILESHVLDSEPTQRPVRSSSESSTPRWYAAAAAASASSSIHPNPPTQRAVTLGGVVVGGEVGVRVRTTMTEAERRRSAEIARAPLLRSSLVDHAALLESTTMTTMTTTTMDRQEDKEVQDVEEVDDVEEEDQYTTQTTKKERDEEALQRKKKEFEEATNMARVRLSIIEDHILEPSEREDDDDDDDDDLDTSMEEGAANHPAMKVPPPLLPAATTSSSSSSSSRVGSLWERAQQTSGPSYASHNNNNNNTNDDLVALKLRKNPRPGHRDRRAQERNKATQALLLPTQPQVQDQDQKRSSSTSPVPKSPTMVQMRNVPPQDEVYDEGVSNDNNDINNDNWRTAPTALVTVVSAAMTVSTSASTAASTTTSSLDPELGSVRQNPRFRSRDSETVGGGGGGSTALMMDNSTELVAAKAIHQEEEDFEHLLHEEMQDRIKMQTVIATELEEFSDSELNVDAVVDVKWYRRGGRGPSCLFLTMVVIIVSIILGVVLSGNKKKNSASSRGGGGGTMESPTAAPTLTEEEALQQLLNTVSGHELLVQESTPQHQAYLWVLELQQAQADDEDHWTPDQLLERYILAVLYWTTGGPEWTRAEGFLSDVVPVCEWENVLCGVDNTVVQLDLGTSFDVVFCCCFWFCWLVVATTNYWSAYKRPCVCSCQSFGKKVSRIYTFCLCFLHCRK